MTSSQVQWLLWHCRFCFLFSPVITSCVPSSLYAHLQEQGALLCFFSSPGLHFLRTASAPLERMDSIRGFSDCVRESSVHFIIEAPHVISAILWRQSNLFF